MAVYLGVDPGAQGSLCLLDSFSLKTEFHPCPHGKTTAHDVLKWLVTVHTAHPIKIVGVEDVHAIRGTSAGSNFKFGFNVGMIRGIVESLGIGVVLINPREWQGTLKIPTKKRGSKTKTSSAQTKQAVAEAVRRLYPQATLHGPRGGLLDGRADALGIAHHIALHY